MIISKSPLRISLGGGGTDLASYYEKHSGFFISAAINRYVYTCINRPFNKKIILKYSNNEEVSSVDKINHNIIREVIRYVNPSETAIEITSLADIPSGTGLGSSGSFTTSLLKGVLRYYERDIDERSLAELACKIEIDILGESIGKQDQYIASFGGIKAFSIDKNGNVSIVDLLIGEKAIEYFEERLLLFFTGFTRDASSILKDQKIRSERNEDSIMDNLHLVKSLGYEFKNAIEQNNFEHFGDLLNQHWNIKSKRSSGMTNSKIDSLYQSALANGARGGKLVGAGGGGFLLLYADRPGQLRTYMQSLGVREVQFKFEMAGCHLVGM